MRDIAIVEPQMEHIFHAPFNAALIHAVVLAFPDRRVSFRALPSHLASVQSILREHSSSPAESVEWRLIDASSVRGSSLTRWRNHRKLFRRVFSRREYILFSSISRMQFFQLRQTMRSQDIAFTVFHGDLDRIGSPGKERFPANLFSLQKALLMPQPRGLRPLLLGHSIRNHIPPKFESAFTNAGVISHPYHFPPLKPPPPGPVVFGIFGNTGDGELLEEIIRKVKAVNPEIVFRLVGFLSKKGVERLGSLIEDAGAEPLSRLEYIRRAESITYTLWLAPPGSYRMRASGTLFDAFAYGKPLIYTANAFIDPCYEQAPGIGIRCATLGEVPEAILKTASGHNAEAYHAARTSIEEFRNRFTPWTLAGSLPGILGISPLAERDKTSSIKHLTESLAP